MSSGTMRTMAKIGGSRAWGVLGAAALWLIPVLAILPLRARRRADEKASAWRNTGPVQPDGEVRSPSRAANVAALTDLPYILQAYDPNRSSGVVIDRKGLPSPGLNFFFPWSWKSPRAYLMDLDGKVLWRWSLDEYVKGHPWLENAALLPDGSVLFSLKDRGIVKVDRASKVLWEAPIHVHHDLWPGEDGAIYALSHEAAVVPDIHPTLPILSDAVAILDARGRIEKTITILDLLRRSGYAYLLPRLQNVAIPAKNRVLDVFHLNHVEPLDGSLASRSDIYRKGNLLISIRNLNAIAIVDPGAEKIVWLWGPGNLTYQHHPRMLPDGNILVFDNGTQRSQVIELDPLTQRVVWRYAPDGFFSALAGGVQRLANGDTLITESMKGRAFEVTPSGAKVWEYANPEITPKGLRNGIIRMVRVDPSTLTFLARPGRVAGDSRSSR